jgi:hypothetical protein
VSDATAASDTSQKIRIDFIFCAVLDAAVASDTENHVHVNTLLIRQGEQIRLVHWMIV